MSDCRGVGCQFVASSKWEEWLGETKLPKSPLSSFALREHLFLLFSFTLTLSLSIFLFIANTPAK
ncbi:hypothetical protein C7212DRAFT_338937 [Tuber magnatum]|uniref:Transmembrane protein n=1 Tax=Tuber magnatum TaxID=42249 RepID=A0A317SCE1_9PEZI|nr:hypothetical protein C7212DRAFT_338937 [Tuber magnatum]